MASRPQQSFLIAFVTRSFWLSYYTICFLLKLLASVLTGKTKRPILLREYLQKCGAGFVKLGQFLSMRYDLLPELYCEELRNHLLDRMPKVPVNQIMRTIEADLNRGRKAEDYRQFNDIFWHFDKEPLASASIAQVHAAKLPDGQAVAVKVMRPGVKNDFRTDLLYLRLFAWIVDSLGLVARGHFGRLVYEVNRFTLEELDFRREARNLDLMHSLMSNDGVDHYTPRVFYDYCGRATITMEKIDGVSLIALMRAVDTQDTKLLSQWYERGITPHRTARALLLSVLTQTIRHKAFQADPHPGNIFVLDGGVIAWVDLGMLGWLDEVTLLQQLKLRKHIVDEQIHAAYQTFLGTLEPIPAGDHSRFEFEVKRAIRDWLIAVKDPRATPEEKSSGQLMISLLQAVRRERMFAPLQLVLLYRAIITADSLILRLDPEIDSLGVLRGFVAEETNRQVELALEQSVSGGALSIAAQTLIRAPNLFVDLIDRLERNPEVFRSRRNDFIGFKMGVLSFLRFVQVAVLLATVVVLIFGPFGWRQLWATMHGFPLGTTIAGVLIILVVGYLANTVSRDDG